MYFYCVLVGLEDFHFRKCTKISVGVLAFEGSTWHSGALIAASGCLVRAG